MRCFGGKWFGVCVCGCDECVLQRICVGLTSLATVDRIFTQESSTPWIKYNRYTRPLESICRLLVCCKYSKLVFLRDLFSVATSLRFDEKNTLFTILAHLLSQLLFVHCLHCFLLSLFYLMSVCIGIHSLKIGFTPLEFCLLNFVSMHLFSILFSMRISSILIVNINRPSTVFYLYQSTLKSGNTMFSLLNRSNQINLDKPSAHTKVGHQELLNSFEKKLKSKRYTQLVLVLLVKWGFTRFVAWRIWWFFVGLISMYA